MWGPEACRNLTLHFPWKQWFRIHEFSICCDFILWVTGYSYTYDTHEYRESTVSKRPLWEVLASSVQFPAGHLDVPQYCKSNVCTNGAVIFLIPLPRPLPSMTSSSWAPYPQNDTIFLKANTQKSFWSFLLHVLHPVEKSWLSHLWIPTSLLLLSATNLQPLLFSNLNDDKSPRWPPVQGFATPHLCWRDTSKGTT